MATNQKVQQFLEAVSNKMGFRFAIELHHSLAQGSTDPKTRAKLRAALKKVR